jgi:hypothetical protein
MTTKTIPAYHEDERRKLADARLRMEEEAARIQPLHHGHIAPRNSPSWNCYLRLTLPPERENLRPAARKKHAGEEDDNESPQEGVTSKGFHP